MTNFEALVLLNMVEGIGSVRLKKLLDIFGQATEIFKLKAHDLSCSGVLNQRMVNMIIEAPHRFKVDKEINEAVKQNVKILTIEDKDYPANLKEIYDPPIVLYIKGDILEADRNAVGVVGSRGASFYGLTCARDFSSRLSQFGLTIVSGMARGIDTAAHRASLDAHGRTLAILGSGLNKIYPPENEGLYEEIARSGAVVSQFPMDTAPLALNFPIRNRIISGLSRGVLVVEATYKSGALITARYALEQGREIFAIPGKVSSETSSGTNFLIKQGAKMVTAPEEILEELKNNLHGVAIPAYEIQMQFSGAKNFDLNDKEATVVNVLNDEPQHVDVLSAETGMSICDILSILMRLELKGVVKQLPGKVFVKNTSNN